MTVARGRGSMSTRVDPCGPYTIRVRNGRVHVHCGRCGPAGSFTPRATFILAKRIACPALGRFEVKIPRPERVELAERMIAAARRARRAR